MGSCLDECLYKSNEVGRRKVDGGVGEELWCSSRGAWVENNGSPCLYFKERDAGSPDPSDGPCYSVDCPCCGWYVKRLSSARGEVRALNEGIERKNKRIKELEGQLAGVCKTCHYSSALMPSEGEQMSSEVADEPTI